MWHSRKQRAIRRVDKTMAIAYGSYSNVYVHTDLYTSRVKWASISVHRSYTHKDIIVNSVSCLACRLTCFHLWTCTVCIKHKQIYPFKIQYEPQLLHISIMGMVCLSCQCGRFCLLSLLCLDVSEPCLNRCSNEAGPNRETPRYFVTRLRIWLKNVYAKVTRS